MGVYIKGMEMPTDCIFCPLFHGAWTMCTVLNKTTHVKGRPDDCPLFPVPPHGRWNNIIQGIIPSGQCSNCGAWDKVTRFCPNCGADMREANDEKA